MWSSSRAATFIDMTRSGNVITRVIADVIDCNLPTRQPLAERFSSGVEPVVLDAFYIDSILAMSASPET